ncbi:MAG TPA: YdcF family protein [Burkholderiales bacterium]|nr:YdcF family protein [Burkholderiales bacterium]
MQVLITDALAALVIPPGGLLLLAAAGALLARSRPRLGRSLVAAALLVLYVLCTPLAAESLVKLLEPEPRDPLADASGQAIVVLGSGTYFEAPEYGGDTVKAETLVRLRYAARLHQLSRKPVLVAGGRPRGGAPEAALMKTVLAREFQVPVRWTEESSRNTLESARLARRLLEPAGLTRIYLVTHAWHMPRARFAFEHAGFSVIPAPTGFATRHGPAVLDFLPDARALATARLFFHEAAGIGWYHLRIALGR